jgi:hypothetical protein
MIPLRVTPSGKRPLILGIVAALSCALMGTRADAQQHDLINAAANGDLPRVKALLDAKADANAKTDRGFTAQAFASKHGHRNIVKLLKTASAGQR